MKNLLSRLVPDLGMVAIRFPIPIVVCVFMFCFTGLEIEDVLNFTSSTKERIYLAGFGAFLSSGGTHLFAEGRKLSKSTSFILALIFGIVAAAVIYFDNVFSTSAFFLIPALILWVMMAGFFRAGSQFNAIWLFNSRLALAIILAAIVAGVFAGGLSAILSSLEYLFGVKVSSDAYAHVANTAIVIIGPLYGMSLIPVDIDEELALPRGDDLLNRGISILINYILVPVLLIFVLILHAYAIKIAVSQSLPKGQVGTMVLLFGIGGTATWLIARPWVQTGTRFLSIFTRYWFWFTIIPTILLSLAVYVRVTDYGLTPDRYGLILVAAWLTAMIGYFAAKKIQAHPQVIIGSFAALLLIGSIGPWGALELSISSQLSRFDIFLNKWGYVKNGKITSVTPSDVPKSARHQASSIIKFLRKQERLDLLKPYFEGGDDDPFSTTTLNYKIARLINSRLSLDGLVGDGGTAVSYRPKGIAEYKVSAPAILFGPFSVWNNKDQKLNGDTVLSLKGDNFTIVRQEKTWSINKKVLLYLASKADKKPKSPMKVELSGPEKMSLIVTQIQGRTGGKKENVRYLNGWLLLPPNN